MFLLSKPAEWVSGYGSEDGSGGSVRKFHRAVADLRNERKLSNNQEPITEDEVKARYIKYGGLVIGDESTIHGNKDQLVEDDEPAPVRRTRKA